MTGASIADLTVLGIASEGPIEADRVVAVAKSLVPEHWQPTASVIAAVIERNLAAGLLRRTENHPMDQHLWLTAEGSEKIRALLLCPPEELAPSALPAAEAIQFCFLDTTDSETAKAVLFRFQRKLEKRLSSYEQRSAKGPDSGRYKNFWLDMEQRRLESMVRFLTVVSNENAMACGDSQNVAEPLQ